MVHPVLSLTSCVHVFMCECACVGSVPYKMETASPRLPCPLGLRPLPSCNTFFFQGGGTPAAGFALPEAHDADAGTAKRRETFRVG